MPIAYKSLCQNVRNHMLNELNSDISCMNLYESPRLKPEAFSQWKTLLQEAVQNYDDQWLTNQILVNNLLNPTITDKNGKVLTMPENAAETLAEGEFNRLYCRGVCIEASKQGEQYVEVYRGKEVQNPRTASIELIGKTLPALDLLNDLRTNPGTNTALGLPPGPNSGLSIKRK